MSVSSVFTLETLRLQAQQRADMENSEFLSELEWNQNITNSYKELYDLIVASYGNNYYVTLSSDIVTDGVNSLLDLPIDFYKLLGVDLVSGGFTYTLKPFNFAERNKFTNIYQNGYINTRYRINGSKLWLSPLPAAGQTVRVWYIPEPKSLVTNSDTMDGVSGWEEYVIVDAAIKARIKEESDISELMAVKDRLTKRIQDMAQNRDAGMPATVTDTSHLNDFYMGYFDGF